MSSQDDRRTRLERVIADVRQRRFAGESLPDSEVVAAHPDLLPDLRRALRKLGATQGVLAESVTPTRVINPTVAWDASQAREAAAPSTQHDSLQVHQDTPSDRGPDDDASSQDSTRWVSHYELLERVGSGGFGTVYRAWDSKLDCQVAVKVPRRRDLSHEEIDRFIREARVAAHLRRHPNIVGVHQAEWDGKIAYIVSDFVEGRSLSAWAGGKPMDERAVAEIGIAIAEALHHAHESGIVHRDLKPDNVMIDFEGEPHITDFGLAKLEGEGEVTVDGQVMGTVAYMAPEQARGSSRTTDRRTDVYALGVMLYELVCAERPFRGSTSAMLRQIVEEEPPSPRRYNPRVSRDFETICLKCLEKDPARRYPTTQALADELRRLLNDEPLLARPVGSLDRFGRWCRRHPTVCWLTLSFVIVTAIGLAIAGTAVDREVRQLQRKLEAQIDRSLADSARWVALSAELRLQEKFRQVRRAARDPKLIAAMTRWSDPVVLKQDLEVLRAWREQAPDHKINLPPLPESLRSLQAWLSADPSWLESGAGRVDRAVGPRLADDTTEEAIEVFSWFICGPDGTQLARDPLEASLGRQYAYRSYFTGRDSDLPRESAESTTASWTREDGPRLSSPFVTEDSSQWVMSISAPIWSEEARFLGVIGVFIRLDAFLELPTTVLDESSLSSLEPMLLDPRDNSAQARIVGHPFHRMPDATNQATGMLRDEVIAARIDVRPTTTGLQLDPFGDAKYGQQAQLRFGGLRRIAHARVRIPGSDRTLLAAVSEAESDLLDPSRDLRDDLVGLGLLIALGGLAALLPAWFVIVKNLR